MTRLFAARHQRGARVCLMLCVMLLSVTTSHAANPYVVFPDAPEELPAFRYAALSRTECLALLDRRKMPFSKGPKVPTIDTPVLLEGPVDGVSYRFAHAPKSGATPPVMDCRLMLALGDLAKIAARVGVRELVYNSIYRGRGGSRGKRHPGGVAIDIVSVVENDGQLLEVKRDFKGSGIGSQTCTGKEPALKESRSRRLRRFICEVHAAHVFNLVLTPHYDRRHDDHFHLEVRSGIEWYLTQ